jgi:hypothetical protein
MYKDNSLSIHGSSIDKLFLLNNENKLHPMFMMLKMILNHLLILFHQHVIQFLFYYF